MEKQLRCKIVGVTALVMHNGELANPLNPQVKVIKKISQKRDKTEADMEELARLEWLGSLYLDKGEPCVPGLCLEATLWNAAKKKKKGMQFRAGAICDGNFPLLYDGPRNPHELWEHKAFQYGRMMTVNRKKIFRMRSIFPQWGLEFVITFDDEVLNPSDLTEFVEIGGKLIGVLEERPHFGRFVLESIG